MELVKAKINVMHGGRVRAKGEVFEVTDRQDSKGIVIEGSAKAEAERLVAEGFAEKASAADVKAKTEARAEALAPLADDEEEVQEPDSKTGEIKIVRRKKQKK